MKPSEKIPLFKVFMADTAAPEVTKVLNSGFIGQGPKVDQFEQQLQDYFNHKHIQLSLIHISEPTRPY